ncbi:uncharacterized protein (DUF1697 family) [Gillisia mitskevichiae]|uniref:Uncharacterized protein (DUF1697 family) n=1 Tax=Gillisia mitskevichiae TaxID=270921 RepID=A0A495PUS5_9FLAO|nr:DUF1697 domain-containing protein [Gillisia mitskevichiae]RKS53302.1 uncharacterized protein (DUF1697 family) [Gillisia mitskevichiae]
MASEKLKEKYVLFLRGINVGGHHKVPMQDLREELEQSGFEKVETILNSGNIIFNTASTDLKSLEILISEKLENAFGFPIPTIVRKEKTIKQLFDDAPFQKEEITKDIRLYVSFLKNGTIPNIDLPWRSSDNSFRILEIKDRVVISILDLNVSKTPKAMNALETFFGSEITTRNWNTIERVAKKL